MSSLISMLFLFVVLGGSALLFIYIWERDDLSQDTKLLFIAIAAILVGFYLRTLS